jgi:hypothetical protein
MKDQPWAAAGRFGRVPALASTKNTVPMPVSAMLRAAAGLDRAPGKRAPRPCDTGPEMHVGIPLNIQPNQLSDTGIRQVNPGSSHPSSVSRR